MKIRDLIAGLYYTLKQDTRNNYKKVVPNNSNEKVLQDDGIIAVPEFLAENICDEIKAKIEDVIKSYPSDTDLECGANIRVRKSFDGKEDYDTGMIDILHIDKLLPELRDKIDIDFFSNIINNSTEENLELNNFNSYVNKSISNTRVYHADSLGVTQFKAFIYLTDVPDLSYGPYCFVKKSHRFHIKKYINLFVNFFNNYPITDMRLYNKENETPMIAKRGTLVVSNQNGFHRGIPQEKGKERMILVFNFIKR